MKTFLTTFFTLVLLSLCACKGNDHAGSKTDTIGTVAPERYPPVNDTPYSTDTVRSDSAVRQKDTAKMK